MRTNTTPWGPLWGVAYWLLARVAVAAAADVDVDYDRDVKPVLKARCYACHGALKQMAGLRLDTGNSIRAGGDGGPAVLLDSPTASPLLERVGATDLSVRMPPEGEALSPQQIERLRVWIQSGAPSPATEQPEADPREHWAFQPVARPDLPAQDVASEPSHPIDAFLNADLARRGVTARHAAARPVLLRRVYLDLIGLPPTPDELHAFLADDSADAYERVVDSLLADPRHGERWARHWMDIWRYSDWYGRRDVGDVRNSASQIFRWRDWIVRSLNTSQGYDRMLQQMLAADEICPEDYDAGVATGYLIRNYYSLNPNDWMRSTVEHTGKAFLGLTFNCAHCHDHKYDPITQLEYFQFRAIFEPIFVRQDRLPGEADPGVFQDYAYAGTRSVQRLGTVRVFDRQLDAPTWFYTGGDERNRVKERGSVPPGVPAFLTHAPLQVQPVSLRARAWYPGLRPEIRDTMLAEARAAIAAAEGELAQARTSSGDLPERLQAETAQAQAALDLALAQARQSGRPGALVGQQSLLLDASSGRRIVQNGVTALPSLADGMTLRFELQLLHDAHLNFQLVKDNVQGLTAGYVGWDQGRILAYPPDSTSEVELARYAVAAGQTRFKVSLVFQPTANQCLLSIRSTSDDVLLVDAAPLRLDGWNPLGNPLQSISFDARTGSIALIDDVVFSSPATEGTPASPILSFDFEPPTHADGADVVGIEGWTDSSYSVAPATSLVSSSAANPDLRDLALQLAAARRAARLPLLRIDAAQSRAASAHADLASLEARLAADLARYDQPASADADELILAASLRERQAALSKAHADRLAAELSLAEAEARPSDAADRAAAIDAASQALAAARTALQQAQTALSDDKLSRTFTPLSQQFPRESTGRRRALAEWITQRQNPLTARVAVNHIWTRHFQAPLVASMYDFGRNGARPTHPQLLDWLAAEFMDSGWDMKHLHRLIVTSAAYRRVSSLGDAAQNLALDPENKLFWRMNSSRMEAEVLRDSLLYVAGRLDRSQGGVEAENTDALVTHRRSLYYSAYPEAGGKSELGELFDAPDPLDCYRRTSSVVPQQALALTNGEMIHQSSAAIVQAWYDTRTSPDENDEPATTEFITAMFETVLSRSPTDAERRVASAALERQRQLAADPDSPPALRQARQALVRILLNHNDFVTVR